MTKRMEKRSSDIMVQSKLFQELFKHFEDSEGRSLAGNS